MTRLVPCPKCRTDCAFDKALNPYRPFCSARCKGLDLGAWASGEYAVQSRVENEDEAQALEQVLLSSAAETLPKH
jgi:uncharacterized protein